MATNYSIVWHEGREPASNEGENITITGGNSNQSPDRPKNHISPNLLLAMFGSDYEVYYSIFPRKSVVSFSTVRKNVLHFKIYELKDILIRLAPPVCLEAAQNRKQTRTKQYQVYY